MEFCPVKSIKAIFGKICQILANSGSLKCDPYVKHLFLWLFIDLQHKLCERYLDIRNKMLKSAQKVCIVEFVSGELFRKQIVP